MGVGSWCYEHNLCEGEFIGVGKGVIRLIYVRNGECFCNLESFGRHLAQRAPRVAFYGPHVGWFIQQGVERVDS